jgi:hypothetical protein
VTPSDALGGDADRCGLMDVEPDAFDEKLDHRPPAPSVWLTRSRRAEPGVLTA